MLAAKQTSAYPQKNHSKMLIEHTFFRMHKSFIMVFFEGPNIKSKILTMVSILIFCSFQFLLSKRCDPSLPGGPQVTN